MATLRPLVQISGSVTELPPGDLLVGAVGGSLETISGVVGGGSLQQGTPLSLSVSLAPNPSGIIRVGDSLGLDGYSLQTAQAAISSGTGAFSTSAQALLSGEYASTVASQALASGNAALGAFSSVPYGTVATFTAASTIPSGYPVGLDDTNRVQVLRSTPDPNKVSAETLTSVDSSAGVTSISDIAWDPVNNVFCVAYNRYNSSGYGYALVGSVDPQTKQVTSYTRVVFRSVYLINVNVVYFTNDSRFLIVWAESTSVYAVSAQVSGGGTTLTYGTPVQLGIGGNSCSGVTATYNSVQNRVLVTWTHDLQRRLRAVSVNCSSGVVTAGTPVDGFYDGNQYYSSSAQAVYAGGSHMYAYRSTYDGYPYGISFTVTSTSVTIGSRTNLYSGSVNGNVSVAYNSSQSRWIAAWSQSADVRIATGTISGTTISNVNNGFTISSTTTFNYTSVIYNSYTNRVYIQCLDINPVISFYVVFTQSGAVPSEVYRTTDEGFSVNSPGVKVFPATAITSPSVLLQTLYYLNGYGSGSDIYVRVLDAGAIIDPSKAGKQNFIGVASTAAASGSTVQVRLPGSYIASSPTILASGAFYYLDPSASGYTQTSAEPGFWTGDKTWGPVGLAIDEAKILITDTM